MYNWKNVLLTGEKRLKDAVRVLNNEALRIVLVVDEDNKLLGTITDGDIRRGLLKNITLDASVSELMNPEPTVALVGKPKEDLLELMKSKELLQIPIVDSDSRVVGLETISGLLQSKKNDNAVFLLAGGKGTRLHPLTKEIPKPLLKVGGTPILQLILEQFISFGFHKFYLSTNYKGEMIQDYFKNGEQWGVSISYINEDEPLGTAGSLSLLEEVGDLPIVVMNGDVLTKVNFSDLLNFHKEHKSKATMCVREYTFQVPYGVIETQDNRIQKIKEKPVETYFVNAGIYVLEPSVVKSLNKNEYLDMTDLFHRQLNDGENTNVFPLFEYWLDIGQKHEYDRAQRDMVEHFND